MRILALILLLAPLSGYAGHENDPAGARAAGLGNAALNFRDIWSIYHNQAGLAHIQGPTAGVFFENRFLISELAYTGFAGATPLGKGALGISYTNFGFSAYRENNFGLAYGLKLGKTISVGVQMNYHSLRIDQEGYGQKGSITAEAGLQFQVSEKVSLAAHIFNPGRTKLNDFDDERIPTVLRLGANYTIAEDLTLSGEVEKDIDRDPTVRGGIEYKPADILYLRIGASSNPNLFAFGIGLDLKHFQVDIASSYHSLLGYSPQVSLTYAPGKK